jgi:glycine/D-amino acid oxidase-like deaminating enzyme
MRWTGTLTWGTGAAAERLGRDYVAMRDLGCAVRIVPTEELAELDPAVVVPSDATVYLEDGGGWVDAPALVDALLAAAAGNGADVRSSAAVTALERVGGEWRLSTTAGDFWADVVVNAAGIWASHVASLAIAPVPVDLRPGLIVYTEPLTEPLRNVLNGPELNVRPDPSGGVAIHWRGEDTYTGHGYNATDPQDVLDLAAGTLPELRGTTPARASVGVRPVPPGGPIIGWHPSADGLFIAVSHGGVGWGPRWGEIATAAIVEGANDPRWGAFSPARFFRPVGALSPAGRAAAAVPAQM